MRDVCAVVSRGHLPQSPANRATPRFLRLPAKALTNTHKKGADPTSGRRLLLELKDQYGQLPR